MSTIQERAAEIIYETRQSHELFPDERLDWDCLAESVKDFYRKQVRALAGAGLLAPDLSEVTRLTVAGGGYRQMEEWGICDVTPQLQDEGRTLKIFYRKGGNK